MDHILNIFLKSKKVAKKTSFAFLKQKKDEIDYLRDNGWTHADITEYLLKKYKVRVSRQAISKVLKGA